MSSWLKTFGYSLIEIVSYLKFQTIQLYLRLELYLAQKKLQKSGDNESHNACETSRTKLNLYLEKRPKTEKLKQLWPESKNLMGNIIIITKDNFEKLKKRYQEWKNNRHLEKHKVNIENARHAESDQPIKKDILQLQQIKQHDHVQKKDLFLDENQNKQSKALPWTVLNFLGYIILGFSLILPWIDLGILNKALVKSPLGFSVIMASEESFTSIFVPNPYIFLWCFLSLFVLIVHKCPNKYTSILGVIGVSFVGCLFYSDKMYIGSHFIGGTGVYCCLLGYAVIFLSGLYDLKSLA